MKMVKKLCLILTMMALASLAWAAVAAAAEITPQRVVDHVNKAVELVVQKGEAEAFKELTDPKGKWVDGDLYVFIYNFKGEIVAHLNKKLEGKNMLEVKDVKGNVFAADFIQVAKSEKGEGWTEYWWPKPNQTEAAPKASFIKRVPGKEILIGVGVYDFSKAEAQKATGK